MATTLIYGLEGTHVKWADSGADLAITLKGLATTAGRQGAVKDFGTSARPITYRWVAGVQFDTATAPVVGETVDIYWKSGDGTNFDNDDGTGDIALSALDKTKNLLFLGSIVVDEAAADVPMQSSGVLKVMGSQGMPVFYNATADTLDDDAATTDNFFELIPISMQAQAAV